MIIEYLFSSPGGDISLGPEDLARPFLITPSEPHPFLTLGDYFEAIRESLLKDQGKPLVWVLKERLNRGIGLDSIKKVLIRSEKHGALYHLASVEVLVDDKQIKLAVSTAVSEKGKEWLKNEYETLKFLNSSLGLPYLQNVYFKEGVECKAGNRKRETVDMFISEWFEGYHEWHLSIDKEDNRQKICIWDMNRDHRFASRKEGLEIYRQASRILTQYYDTQGFRQIYPWHHAAGDFVVREVDGAIDLKLTTAREYRSVIGPSPGDSINPMIALIYFFLSLTVKMRLDKLDGVGETAWAGTYCMEGTIQGFMEAIRVMEKTGRYGLGSIEELVSLLTSFDRKDLMNLIISMLGVYDQEAPGDFPVIQANLETHVEEVHQIIQNLSLGALQGGC